MTDSEFDAAVVAAVFTQAGERGWHRISIAEAVRAAGLDLARARARFPAKLFVLMRFGSLADQAALTGATTEGPVKDRLFDIIMRRFDVLQAHRAGVRAVLDAARFDPALGLILTRLSTRSMGWLLEGAGISASGLRGHLRMKGLLAVWLYAVRAWADDDSTDLASTMTAVDKALDRAGMLARYLGDKAEEDKTDAEAEAKPEDDLPVTTPPPSDP
ncbi:MAG TPA: TetR family transcriptional regulator, partial [Acidisoma sp.]|nr:TetR family transcriptional regulator [Acidisoma sp.]